MPNDQKAKCRQIAIWWISRLFCGDNKGRGIGAAELLSYITFDPNWRVSPQDAKDFEISNRHARGEANLHNIDWDNCHYLACKIDRAWHSLFKRADYETFKRDSAKQAEVIGKIAAVFEEMAIVKDVPTITN
ncbi:MAG: hypothetical protein WCT26_04605 [Candidatus Buchananbacteria bacterium]|jgi:hypothetical protein